MKICRRQLTLALFLSLALTASATTRYVDVNSTSATPPFLDWSTAATNIQDAVDAAVDGDQILVTNGVYRTGGTVIYGLETNRVALANLITLLSVNGPQATTIVGGTQTRCVYVGSNAVMSGFTVTNGLARASGDAIKEMNGGGIWCEFGGVVTNCVIRNNSAPNGSTGGGGGVYGGTLYNCTLIGNSGLAGGGVRASLLWDCTLSGNTTKGGLSGGGGGGAYGSILYNCTLSNNSANAYLNGGGACQCVLSNCVVNGNATTSNGGGASGSGAGTFQGTNYYCVIAANAAGTNSGTGGGTGRGGGTSQSVNYNCLIKGNTAGASGGGIDQGSNYNCTITANIADTFGGGAYGGMHENCLLINNAVTSPNSVYGYGGGAYTATLHTCTLTGNAATNSGGGVYGGTLYNSIVYYNSAPGGSNWTGSPSMSYCCTTPFFGGSGNITNEPAFVDPDGGVFKLKCGSPCIDAGGGSFLVANDIRGEPRPLDGNGDSLAKYDLGAYEYNPATDQTPVIRAAFSFTTFATSYAVSFVAQIGGCADYFWWDFGDGVTVSNQYNVSHAWVSPGQCNVQLSAYYSTLGQSLTATTQVQVVQQPVYYADASNLVPVSPYTNWTTAANGIQQAVAAGTTPGRLVLVTNGLYRGSGVAVNGSILNSVALTNAVVVQSVNGSGVTVIQPPSSPRRPAYVGSNSFLIGFTLTGGVTLSTGDTNKDRSGGGVWCETGGVVSNCVVAGNRANYHGGGAYQGTFYNCVFTNNLFGFSGGAQGGGVFGGTLYNSTIASNSAATSSTAGSGASQSTLYNCVLTGNHGSDGGGSGGSGGGAYLSMLYDSTLSNNRADFGGGAYLSTLRNCVLSGNIASQGGGSHSDTLYNCIIFANQAYNGGNSGGGAYNSTLYNCTVAGNSATGNGGGVYQPNSSTAYNSIIYFNTASGNGPNWFGSLLAYNCCTTPLPPPNSRNLTNDPIFLNLPAGDLHLRFGSPCIDAGTNLSVLPTNDLVGNVRPLDGDGDGVAKFDIGAYEFNLVATVGINWFISHGLDPNDPLVFASDPDGDGLTTLQEWIAGTDPTNTLSALKMLSPANSVSGVSVTWQSASGVTYFLQRSTNLSVQPAFYLLQSNIVGQVGTTTYMDTSAIGPGPFFYRVGVQPWP